VDDYRREDSAPNPAPNVVSWGCVRRDGSNAASAEPRVHSEVVASDATGRNNRWSLKIRCRESGLRVRAPPPARLDRCGIGSAATGAARGQGLVRALTASIGPFFGITVVQKARQSRGRGREIGPPFSLVLGQPIGAPIESSPGSQSARAVRPFALPGARPAPPKTFGLTR
jgi:hypothetical protein